MPIIVKNTTFPGLLDLLAPHSCRGCGRIGSVLCDCCKNNIIKTHVDICPKCKAKKTKAKCSNCPNLPSTYIVGERSGPLGNLIHNLKYQSVRAAAKPLAELLDATLPAIKDKVVIVPLPTITKHIRTRGLDHTYLIAKNLAKLRGKNYQVKPILLRNQNTVQVGTDQKTRLKQADSAYKINPRIIIDKNTTYLLLDDVWTTGASLRASEKKLREAGAKKIKLAVLALSRID
ncbi:ComF family protein [Candidatus Saccharibacteria bacterium]|nr:ComF family protein [Candidatus Saccharibacteria bacterium]